MSKKRGHSKISQLPETVRLEVENQLIAGYTYAQISEYLSKMGKSIHAMSVQRYGKPFLERFEAVRMAKRYAKAVAEDNADRPTTELHEANNAMISQLLMETLMSDDIESSEKLRAANAIAQLQSAQVRNEKLKIDARKASGEIKAALDTLCDKIYDEIGSKYPEIADRLTEIAKELVPESQ